MVLTKKELADMLMRYVNREIAMPTLVHYAEDMMRESDFESNELK